jgi:hypothetical protein
MGGIQMEPTNQYQYYNYQKTYPLVEIKYAHRVHQVTIPTYDPFNRIAIDEFFYFIDDRVVNNVIHERYMVSNYGRIFDRCTNQLLNPVSNGNKNADGTDNPYYKVKLSYYKNWNEIAAKDVYIHRVVLLTFGYYPYAEFPDISGVQVNHIDGNHANNHISNLEWLTPEQNTQHSIINGLRDNILIDNNLPINDPKQPIRVICSLMEQGYNNKEISNMTKTNMFVIADIRRGNTYKAFSQEYNFNKKNINKETEATVKRICELLQAGWGNTQIANELGVKAHVVSDIKARRNYTYISSNYNW